jgi:hypothetical protein
MVMEMWLADTRDSGIELFLVMVECYSLRPCGIMMTSIHMIAASQSIVDSNGAS